MNSESITITHFINPQLFWFHEAKDVSNEEYQKLKQIEKEIQDFYNKMKPVRQFEPNINDKVAVLFLPWNKYLRCFVRLIKQKNEKQEKSYYLWAMDYGFPIQTTCEYIRVLPDHLAINISFVRRGGMADVQPILQEFDYSKLCPKTNVKGHWSNVACQIIQNLIEGAATISFTDMFYVNRQYWGKLSVKLPSGKTIVLNDSVVEWNLAKPFEGNFREACLKLPCLKFRQWEDNKRRDNLRMNVVPSVKIPNSNGRYKNSQTNCEMLVEKKEAAQRKHKECQLIASTTDSIGNMNIEDKHIDYDDFELNISRMGSNLGGAALKKSTMQKYKTAHEPLPPLPEHFEMIKAASLTHRKETAEIINNNENANILEENHIMSRLEYIRNMQHKFARKSEQDSVSVGNGLTSETVVSNRNCTKDYKTTRSNNNHTIKSTNWDCTEKSNDVGNKMNITQTGCTSKLQRLQELRAQHSRKNDASACSSNLGSDTDVQKIETLLPATKKSCGRGKIFSMFTEANNENWNMPQTLANERDLTTKHKILHPMRNINVTCNANNSDRGNKIPINLRNAINQNFRFTRAHLDKIKSESSNHVYDVESAGKPKNTMAEDDKIQLESSLENSGQGILDSIIADSMVLQHASVPCKPVLSIPEALSNLTKMEMLKMNFKKPIRLQAYAWPQIQSNQSVFIVSQSGSGRTWCYMPALCDRLRLCSEVVLRKNGPTAIVIVATSRHVETVVKYCKSILSDQSKYKVVGGFGYRNVVDSKIQLLNGCTLLVTTLGWLQRLLDGNKVEPLLNSDNLQQIVIDDLDLLLARHKDTFNVVMNGLRSVVDFSNVQLIVISRVWSEMLKSLVEEVQHPVLLFGDFIEAAVYNSIKFSMMMTHTEKKINIMSEYVLTNLSNRERTIIFCNRDSEVQVITKKISRMGYSCLGFDNSTSQSEIDMMHHWRHNESNIFEILVCTDQIFPKLNVTRAKIIIHYAMPSTWTLFTKRFASMRNSLEDLINCNFKRDETRDPIKSVIILDERNRFQVPRFVTFLEQHNCHVPIDLSTLAHRVSRELDQTRVIICPSLMEFGDCMEFRCEFRHQPSTIDFEGCVQELPQAQAYRISILKVLSPTTITARLLQFKMPDSTEWQSIPHSSNFLPYAMGMNIHYANPNNCHTLWPLNVKDLCVLRQDNEFHRAQILKVEADIKEGRIVKVKLILIDLGTVIVLKKYDNILVLDAKFEHFPPQAYHIHLLNVVPHDGERTWDRLATNTVHQWIVASVRSSDVVQIDVKFNLSNHIWVGNLLVLEKLTTSNHLVQRTNLKRSLIEKNFGARDDNVGRKIRELVEKYQLSKYEESEITTDLIDKSSPSENSHKQNQTFDLISFSSNDSTKGEHESRTKANEHCFSANKDNSVVKEAFAQFKEVDKMDDEIGVLKKSDTSEYSAPASVSNVASSLTSMTNDIARPIQEKWACLALDKLVKVNINETYCDWNSLFLQQLDATNTNEKAELQQFIKDFVENTLAPPKKLNEDALYPFLDCILLEKNIYYRAKIYALYRNGANRICKFFLCDTGSFVTCDWDKIASGSLFQSTKDIIECMPFQAIHCTLGGIRVPKPSIFYELTNKSMYAYGIRESPTRCSTIKNLAIHSYEILLYEWDEKDAWNMAKLMNRLLVNTHGATFNEETKHYLDKEVHLPGDEVKRIEAMPEDLVVHGPHPKDEEDVASEVSLSLANDNAEEQCSVPFEELMRCLEAHFQIEQDSGTYTNDDGFEIIEFENEERRKAICAPTDDENVAQEKEDKYENKKSFVKEELNTSSLPKRKEIVSDSTKSLNDVVSSVYDGMPALKCDHKRPVTTWYQTDFYICLRINAPDISKYHLEVRADSLKFLATINEEKHAFFIKLMGTVDADMVAHEIRGLQVVVFLKKAIPIKWPRLTNQSQKFPWLTYNIGFFIDKELDRWDANRVPENMFNQGKIYPDDDDLDDDDAEINFNKLTPTNDDHFDLIS